MTEKIAVLGAGSWGSVLAKVLVENGHEVALWSNSQAQVDELNQQHTNAKYLPDLIYPEALKATTDLKAAVKDAGTVLFVVPTKVIRLVAQQLIEVLEELGTKPLIVHASKGLELGSHKRISEVIAEEIPTKYRSGMVVLSGPSHAEEVARQDITLITAASEDLANAKKVQALFMNDYLRIYTNSDVVGVETGAAFKNVIAIGAGALHGLGYGDDAKAALMTRGLAEISRLGVSFGADPLTFIGLSGVGDLIVTCTSVHSRNWRAGDQLGQGKSLEDVIANMGMVIEGINTCKAAYELAQQKGIEMPITQAIYNVLYKQADIKSEIANLMQREGKTE
ncbi:NAD(P)H-dependent glycerol-3-phosphate dehydrogenase [Ligilactobacillus agilis]|uniref:Glycerol-3-phosphate dehydrogenase [NAD(P)+] n=1 Tax=Ligilactobacillus agilis TaxID=1601 RepID=A0A222W2F5_9LACO|nr:NAD(P)H-dependent glycerol-3-phosphate dehydrogenase [Ligilactobacillus agilis]ASR40222.1 glycerol-3-phosphate dehydrogenase [Ligilactobacillus agilis]MBL1055793.1 NAD(P)H-dependent glycerol-3-phosphate dehydrogenase [Ligilactobacillus agilis]MBM6762204.1 NAD(P)H-dependent glycerol-3-phosphate dehydrogenase [Ligilactobacillus agilis]MBM6773515.1 NAD(P)H-dependent glycerol-3-phosphate dehydrogenase [Ligilactobacillus agilis]MCI5761157.1 NAD(P)H-dependent glycerol-3-phosphate dehydrogenase [L